MRLMIHADSYRRLRDEITAAAPDAELVLVDPDGTIRAGGGEVLDPTDARPQVAWANADVFLGPAARPYLTAALKSPDLQWVQSGAAGVDDPVFRQIIDKGARLTTSHGQALGIADYVLWGVLDHFQKGPERRAAQQRGEWAKRPFREIAGSRWTLVGFGAIGQAVAARAKAFGARVTGLKRSAAPHPAADLVAPMAQVLDHLPDADVVVLCCPLSAETRHIADAGFFAAMKPGSVLVNVGRGGLVDEPALLAALDRGAPEHAVLDVFEVEPLPADSPFWRHPRVNLNAHASGITEGMAARNDQIFLENLKRYATGEPLLHEADAADVRAGAGTGQTGV